MLLHAYIAAGGKSSRFGGDKARAVLRDSPLIVRVADQLKPHVTKISVIADIPDKYADLGLRTIADRRPGNGPLSALDAALADAAGESWIILASCDLVEIRPDWIKALIAAQKPDLQAVAFRHQFWEPLFALYHTSLLPEVERRLTQGTLSMQNLLDHVRSQALTLPADWPWRNQANTPDELRQAQENMRKEKTVADDKNPNKLPGTYKAFISKFPALGKAHEEIAKAADEAGPLDRKTCELIKIGLSVGGGLESATRSHIRRAMEHGATETEIEQAILLAMNTCGFPRTVMAWQWAQIQFERQRQDHKQ